MSNQQASASTDVSRDTKITEISHLPLHGYSSDSSPLDDSVCMCAWLGGHLQIKFEVIGGTTFN